MDVSKDALCFSNKFHSMESAGSEEGKGEECDVGVVIGTSSMVGSSRQGIRLAHSLSGMVVE